MWPNSSLALWLQKWIWSSSWSTTAMGNGDAVLIFVRGVLDRDVVHRGEVAVQVEARGLAGGEHGADGGHVRRLSRCRALGKYNLLQDPQIAHQRGGQSDPDERTVLVDVTFVHRTGLSLAIQQALYQLQDVLK